MLRLFVLLSIGLLAASDCTSYGTTYFLNCMGTLDIYNQTADAQTECAKWPMDMNCNVTSGAGCSDSNSVQCREYHANLAAGAGAATHCPHAAPNGGITDISSAGLCHSAASVTMGTTVNGNCDDYCNWITMTCPTYYAFSSMDACRAACKFIAGANDTTYSPNPASTPATNYPVVGPTTGNTLGCKRYHVYVANSTNTQATHCPHATAGGGQCGTDCDFYCDLFMSACGGQSFSFADRPTCMSICMQYHTNSSMITATSGNNLQCRIYHAMVASQGQTNAATHCPHAGQFPTAQCVDPPATNCSQFCSVYETSCMGALDIYAMNMTNCMRECMFWPSDVNCQVQDGTGCANSNSWQCRAYHAMAAGLGFTGFNTTHCPHASPVGAGPGMNITNGFCQSASMPAAGVYANGNCDDFCNVVVPVCGQGQLTHGLCMSVCNYVNGSKDTSNSLSLYPPTDPGSANTLKCRRYHSYVASTSAANAMIHCPHALTGSNVCGSNCNFYCDLMQGACTGSYTDYNACLTACNGFTSNGGNYSVTTGNTLECRSYHVMVATTGAQSASVHCPHAQAHPAAGTPCASAASTTVGLLTVLLVLVSSLAM